MAEYFRVARSALSRSSLTEGRVCRGGLVVGAAMVEEARRIIRKRLRMKRRKNGGYFSLNIDCVSMRYVFLSVSSCEARLFGLPPSKWLLSLPVRQNGLLSKGSAHE